MTKFLLATGLLGLSFGAFAQQNDPLPNGMTPAEVHLIPAYTSSRASLDRGVTSPPTFPVRTMAEWEEIQSLVISWEGYEGILKQIARYAKDECEVIIVCADQTDVSNYLMNSQYGGPLPNLNNISFIEMPSNSVWMRDYGAECMYMNEVDSLFLMDWIYNRPRPLDDVTPDAVSQFKNIEVFSASTAPYDLVHTGGNFMADGFGTAFSSALVYDENGANGQFNQTVKTPAQVDQLMEDWMGIDVGRYIVMPTLPYDDIHHIDMHMKLIDEETLLVGEFPVGVSDGPQLESNLTNVVSGFDSKFGTPYELIRIPMVPSTGGAYPPQGYYRTFANNVFVNKTVLVPTYREEFDTTGLRILRESLPGYRVVGIDCDDGPMNIIAASGAIHCITKGIGVADPLLISHQRLRDTYDVIDPYTVEAYIRHTSDIANAQVYWTTDTAAGFTPVPMTAIGNNDWTADIPVQAAGSDVFYYIHAEANSGKEQVRPLVAPEGWWKFSVLNINTGIEELAPVIVDVYPNPASSLVVVQLQRKGTERVQVGFFDALGREVLHLHNGSLPSDGRLFADVSQMAPGNYSVVVQSAGGRQVQRLVVN